MRLKNAVGLSRWWIVSTHINNVYDIVLSIYFCTLKRSSHIICIHQILFDIHVIDVSIHDIFAFGSLSLISLQKLPFHHHRSITCSHCHCVSTIDDGIVSIQDKNGMMPCHIYLLYCCKPSSCFFVVGGSIILESWFIFLLCKLLNILWLLIIL